MQVFLIVTLASLGSCGGSALADGQGIIDKAAVIPE